MNKMDFRGFCKSVASFTPFPFLLILILSACASVGLDYSATGLNQQSQATVTATDSNFIHHFGLPEALVPIGSSPTDQEKQVFQGVLNQFSSRQVKDDIKTLTDYLEAYPQSPWRIALLTNFGLIHYNAARFSQATEAFSAAWQKGKSIHATGVEKALIDRALGELIRMHARLGHEAELRQLLADIQDRSLTGAATEMVAGAKEGLWVMENEPGVAYLCGPKALESIIDHFKPAGAKRTVIENARSGPKGYSLDQVAALAQQANVPHHMVKRKPGSEWVFPAVVHWKSSHYAALLEERDGRIHIKDPTFGGDLWVTLQSLEQEISGYMLIPIETLPKGYQMVAKAEAGMVFGRGYTGSSSPENTKPSDDKTKCDASTPMCQYNFHTLLVSLNISDTPVSYTPPLGTAIRFEATYNQREANQPANFTYANLGPKWTFNWLTYLEDDPSYAGRDIKRYVAGGGAEYHTGYNPTTQSFAPQNSSRGILVRTSQSPIRYELRWPDGSIDVFAQADGGSVYPRKVFLTEKRDAQGNTAHLSYDADLRIVQIADALGQVTVLAYEDATDPYKITRVTDPFGRSATFTYQNGLLVSITDPIGIQSQVTYGANQFINTLTTPYGITTFAYGESGTSRWLESTDPQGDKERLEYLHGAPGIPFSESIVPQGLSPVFNSYINGRNSFYWDKHAMKMAPGNYTKARLTHWLHGVNTSVSVAVKESEKQPLENRVWYSYPDQTWGGGVISGMIEKPRQIARVLDDGSTQLYRYDYNALAKVTRAIDPLGRETVYEYSADGTDLLYVKQKNGNGYDVLAQFSYNSQHRPMTYQDAGGIVTTFAWNDKGQLASVTDALNHTTTYQYDTLGYLQQIINALGHVQASFSYDSAGRIATATDDSGYTLAYSYDAVDRIVQITYPDGAKTTRVYDKLDLASETDRLGHTTRYAYNPLRQLTQITDALGQITRFTWCGCDSLETLTDALGHITRFEHDLQGRLTSKRYVDGQGIDYRYENTTSRLKSRSDALGQIIGYRYAKDDAINDISYANSQKPTANRHFVYDRAYPRLIAFDNGQGQTTLSYIAAGQPGAGLLAEESRADGYRIQRRYDALNRLLSDSVIDAGQHAHANSLVYDDLSRIVGNDTELGRFEYAYDRDSLRLAQLIYPNQTQTRFGYYDIIGDLRLQTLEHVGLGGSVFAGHRYSYDVEGRVTGWQRHGTENISEAFVYDDIGQLLQVSHIGRADGHPRAIPAVPATPGGHGLPATPATPAIPPKRQTSSVLAYAYAYDDVGNRIQETIGDQNNNATYNALNQLLFNGSDSYSHDAEGNQSERISATQGNRRFLWDAENRLIGIEDSNDSSTRSEFSYDALGRRIGITDQNQGITIRNTRLVYCGSQLCAEEDLVNDHFTRFYGDGEAKDGQGSNYHRDHLGSVRAVTDAAGSIKASYGYDPYGRRTTLSGEADDSSFGYTGHYLHQATSLALAPYRAYDAEIGRWISRDPIGEMGGINLYAYVYNNPLGYNDPYGLWGWGDPLNQSFVNAVAGVGDGISSSATLGMYSTADVRNSLGINGGVNQCSASYTGGKYAGYAWGTATLWAAGLNGGSNSVFWSGPGNMKRAAQLGTSLESTPIGALMNYFGNNTPYWMWKVASVTYAGNAKGRAIKVGIEASNIWLTIERPILNLRGIPITFIP